MKFVSTSIFAQEPLPATAEQQLENLADAEQMETEDDAYLQQLVYLKRNPLNINTADENDLRELRMLTDLQIINFILYRKILGRLINIYELQAIPGWDVFTIRKLLPYITVGNSLSVQEDFSKRIKNGQHVLISRISQVLEKAKGFTPSATSYYLGGRQKIFFRYRYQYKNLLQYGIVGDKDAGEPFFKSAQKTGFDFYSFHLFARKVGIIQLLAIGDFTVNMGQGLIQWQSLAFKKSADVLGIKRQSAVLRPYNAAGEFYFNRGAGITIKEGKMEATAFASVRKLSANFAVDSSGEDVVSSFLPIGYHRTLNEINNRHKLQQINYGANITYKSNRWHLSLNGIHYHFSTPVQKRPEPYNNYAISGNKWSNYSMDYNYTGRNFHLFGEAAIDKNIHTAFINGLLISVDPKVDLSFVQRTISKEYQAVYGNAFTENTYPANETGWYAGISIRPYEGWRLDAYADIFKFPWLKYLVDAPSHGTDFLAQLTYSPNKLTEIYTRFRNESKQANAPDNTTVTNYLVSNPKQNWRTQLSYKINSSLTLRNRVELIWYGKDENKENGFLTFFDFIYKPMGKAYSVNLRLAYFETDGYNSRIYTYENDVLYSFSIPQFSNKGMRYYLNFNYDAGKHLSFWVRWAQTIYKGKTSIGSGLDEIKGNKRSEIKLQALFIL